MAEKCSKDWKTKATNKNVRTEGKQWEAAQTERDKGRLTGQKGGHRNVHTARLILSFCAAAQLQCADYESIIWDWQPCSYSTACQTNSQPPSFSAFSSWAHTIAVWWRLNDWRGNEVKCERLTEIHTLREAGDAESAKKKKRKKAEIERRCGEHRLNAAAIKGANLCQRIC